MNFENHIIEFKDVRKAFGTNEVLSGLNIKVPAGKITFIIGRSGEGKSVTLKHIVGILKPDSGEIFIDGEEMTHATGEHWIEKRKSIGLLFQDGALFDSLSVSENVVFALQEFSGLSLQELNQEIKRLLALVGLPEIEEKYPPELSIGEKKRVGLARALAMKPKILLYDEPTTGMDSLVSELVDDLILSMQKRIPGLSSIVISHDPKSILTVADHIIFLHQGKAYFEGSPEEMKASTDPLVIQFLSGSSQGPLAKVIG